MTLKILGFFLNKDLNHGQNDKFLRAFLLKLNLCRPQEDLSFWETRNRYQNSIIILFHKVKNLKIFTLDKTDSANQIIQNCFVNERIEEYKRSLKFREKLIFIELINDSEKHSAYQLIENKSMIEFLQLRKEIEIKEWLESCLKDLEDKNYFKNVYKSLSSKLEENIKN